MTILDRPGASYRRRRLILAYVTSGSSKVFSTGVHLLALPMAAASLSPERFGALFVLAAIGSFLTIAGQGFSPAVSFAISHSQGKNQGRDVGGIVWTTVAIGAASSALAILLGVIAALFIDPVLIVGSESQSFAEELRMAVAVVAVHVGVYYAFAYTEGIRAAYLEHHVTNIFTAIAAVSIFVTTALVAQLWPQIAGFYLAFYVIPLLVQGLGLVTMVLCRRKEWGPPRFDRAIGKELCSRALNFSRAQFGISLFVHGTVYIAGQVIGLQVSGLLGATMRFIGLTQNLLWSLISPLLPSLTHALSAQDIDWAHRMTRRLLVLTIAGPALIGLTLATAGEPIFALWLGLAFPGPSFTALALGLAAAAYISSFLNYMVLTALDDPAWGSKRLLSAGVAGILLGFIGAIEGGLMWLTTAQASALLFLAAIPLYLRVLAKIRVPKSPNPAIP